MGPGTKPTSGSEPGGSSGRDGRRAIIVLLLAIPELLVSPFIVFWRALRSIWGDPSSRGILIAAAWLLIAGTLIFTIIEDLSLVDGFYFSFITLATIGYGDIAPATDLGKIVTVIYGIAGLGIIAALISAIGSRRLGSRRRDAVRPAADEVAPHEAD